MASALKVDLIFCKRCGPEQNMSSTSVLKCDVVLTCRWVLTFRRNILPPPLTLIMRAAPTGPRTVSQPTHRRKEKKLTESNITRFWNNYVTLLIYKTNICTSNTQQYNLLLSATRFGGNSPFSRESIHLYLNSLKYNYNNNNNTYYTYCIYIYIIVFLRLHSAL